MNLYVVCLHTSSAIEVRNEDRNSCPAGSVRKTGDMLFETDTDLRGGFGSSLALSVYIYTGTVVSTR
jgi:hypothetical protein